MSRVRRLRAPERRTMMERLRDQNRLLSQKVAMNGLVYHIGSGQSFFTGMALVLFAVGISYWQRPIARRLSAVPLLLGVAAIAFASAAIPYWIYALLALALLLWLASPWWPKWRDYLVGAVVASCLLAVAWEAPHHVSPSVRPVRQRALGVIGDSVTAGVDDGSLTWPTLLADDHAIEVQDSSHVGDTAESALKRIKKQPLDAPLVVIEIGGNDLLGSTSAAQFADDLDALLTELAAPDRQLVMFELPLPPLYHEYGRAQRSVARKHGVKLIPKRLFLNIIAPKDATLDTIHLSADGQRQMADCVWRIVGPAYE